MTKRTQEIMQVQQKTIFQLQGIDYVEFYVGNARQAAYFYRTAFGFTLTAYAGLETGLRDHISFIAQQGDIRLMLTAPLDPESSIAKHVNLHGDGVKDIAFRVDDAAYAFEETVKRGARPIMEPTVFEDREGQVIKATIATPSDTVHSFIQRRAYHGTFFPHFQTIKDALPAKPLNLAEIDHLALSVEAATLDEWVRFYCQVLGFHQMHQEQIVTEKSAMNSKVVQDNSGKIKFPLSEPASGKRKSQIEEYLASYRGPGVQHLALTTDNIVKTVQALRTSGIEFVSTPKTYYEMLEDRVGKIDEDMGALREQNILVDRDEWGYLLQIFSRPVQSRPTFFLEIIQRRDARGFGSGNIRALFEAIERDQALRGNL